MVMAAKGLNILNILSCQGLKFLAVVLIHVLVTLRARDPVPFVVLIHAWQCITENCGIVDDIWHNMGFKHLPGLPFKHEGPYTLTIYLQTWCSYSLSEGEFLILPRSFFFFFLFLPGSLMDSLSSGLGPPFYVVVLYVL